MKAEKIRDLGDHELAAQAADVEDRLFRLRFQMAMGQTDGLKKYHELRKDRARMRTVQRERELAQEKQDAGKRRQG